MLFIRAENEYVILETENDVDKIYILYKYDMEDISRPVEVNSGFQIRVYDVENKYTCWGTYLPCIKKNTVISQHGGRVPLDWEPSRFANRYIDKFNIGYESNSTEESLIEYNVTPSWKETDTEGETERLAILELENTDDSDSEPEATDIYYSIARVGFYT
jgi:hypothetical protein